MTDLLDIDALDAALDQFDADALLATCVRHADTDDATEPGSPAPAAPSAIDIGSAMARIRLGLQIESLVARIDRLGTPTMGVWP